jgi:hypothetical protein
VPPDRQPHARRWAERASSGINIALMNRLVAAATITAGWRIGTADA